MKQIAPTQRALSGRAHSSARRLTAALVVSMVVGFAMPAFAATTVVSQNSMGAWQLATTGSHANTSATFVNGVGTPPSGAGSLRLTIGAANEFARLQTAQFAGMRLDAITTLSYHSYVANNAPQAIALKLWVNHGGGSPTNEHLIFEPSNNGSVSAGSWTQYNALAGQWWSTATGQAQTFTLADFIDDHPDAVITLFQDSLALEVGSTGATATGFVGYADALTLNSTTYDFENVMGSFTTSPADGARVRSVDVPFVSASSNQDIQASSTLVLRDKNSNLVAGNTTLEGPTSTTGGKREIRFTPAEPLTQAASPYTAELDADQVGGNTELSWTFHVDNTPPSAPSISAPANGSLTNAPNPITVSGTAEPNSTMRVIRAGSTLAIGSANGSGAWSFNIPLGDGSHTISATSTDAAGNATASSPVTFTIDRTAPAAPTIASPANGSVHGTNPITISGTAEPGAQVEIREGAALVATATATGGSFSVTHAFADGVHTIEARARDAANNLGPASTSVTFTVDTNQVNPVITTPAEGATVTTTTVGVTGSAEGNATVHVFEGATLLGTTTANGSGAWATTITATQGSHTIHAQATDAVTNVITTSANRTFSVDSVPPATPVIDSPAENQVVATVPFDITGTAENGSSVAVFEGATLLGSAPSVAGSWTLAGITLPEGTHTITARATDAAGNVGPSTLNRAFIVDAAAPALVSTDPAHGETRNAVSSVSATYSEPLASGTLQVRNNVNTLIAGSIGTSGNTVTFTPTGGSLPQSGSPYTATTTGTDTGTATTTAPASFTFEIDASVPDAPVISAPADGSVFATNSVPVSGTAEANSTVTVYRAGTNTVLATTPANGAGAWSTTLTGLAEGQHSIEATAKDAGNNEGGRSADISFTVDTIDPAAPVIVDPAENEAVNTSSVSIEGTSEPGADIEVRHGVTVIGTTTADGSGDWSLSHTFSDGTHEVSARATDGAGNVGPYSGNRTFTVDTAAPDTTITGGPSGVTNSSSASFTFTSTESGTFECRIDAGAFASCSSPSNYSGLTDGSHTFQVRAIDDAGNVDNSPASTTWTVDTTAPDTSITSGPSGLVNSADATFEFSSNDAGAAFECSLDSGSYVACSSPHMYTGLSDGAHTFQVRARDAANNLDPSPASAAWTIDATAPGAPVITTPAEAAALANAAVSISGTAEAGSTVEIREAAALIATATANGSGDWSVTHSFSDGTHVIDATARDAANNTGPASASRTFSVDTQAPGAPVIATPTEGAALTTSTVTINGTSEANATVTVREGATVKGTAVANGTGGWSMSASFSDGPHTITATAADAVGNVSPASAPRSFTVDATPPAAPVITLPAEGSVVTSTVVTIQGTAEANSTVRVYEGATQMGVGTASGSGLWTINAAFTPGAHTVVARATDAAGNVSPSSAPRSFTVTPDTTPPAKPVITAPANGSTHGPSVMIQGTAEPNSTVTVRAGTSLIGSTPANPTGGWSLNASFATGTYTLTATARDAAGNVSDPSDPVTFSVDGTRPTVTIDTPNNSVFLPGDEFTVNGTARDAGGVDHVLVEYFNALGTRVEDIQAPVSPAGGTDVTWSATATGLLPGPYTVRATAVDRYGNRSIAASATFIVVSA